MTNSANGISIVLFSSGLSEKSGILHHLKYRLEEYDYQVSEWRDLFAQAVNEEQIALLPMLIKKIPSFDYAILICEGHDETTLIRNGEEIREKTMRDNVLFEIGLCVMALGPEKVILLSDESVRLPEDLSGVNGGIALPAFRFDPWNTEEMELTAKRIHEIIERTNRSIDGIHDYIEQTTDVTAPMVIGAANALAVSYMRNFVFRLIEKLDEPPIFKPEDQHIAEALISQGAWKIHILLPSSLHTEDVREFLGKDPIFSPARIEQARFRPLNFQYLLTADTLHIVDFPSIVTASYDTVKRILELNADDSPDRQAKERFQIKEIRMFEHTLRTLLCEDYVQKAARSRSRSEGEYVRLTQKLMDGIEKVEIRYEQKELLSGAAK